MTLSAARRRPTWICNLSTLAYPLERVSPSSAVPSTPSWGEKLIEVLSTRPTTWLNHQHPASSAALPRLYSTKHASDDPYRGLALPYPSDARLDTDVFEDSTTLKDYELPSLLPHLIRTQQFAAARRAKAQVIRDKQLSKIAFDDVYETMALQALDPRQNELGVSRIDAFLGWWSLVPPAEGLIYTRCQPPAIVARINSILHQIIQLEPLGGGNEALIRFSLLAARKGYARAAVSRHAIPHIVLWCPPAISAKFLRDFESCAMGHDRGAEVTPETERANRVLRTQWYRRAILTQITAGRLREAFVLFSEQCQRPEIGFDKQFLLKMLLTFHKAGLKNEHDALQAAYATAFPDAEPWQPGKEMDGLRGQRFVGCISAPSISKDPMAALRYIRRSVRSGRLISSKYLAQFKFWALKHHGGPRLLRYVEDELLQDVRRADRKEWKAYQNRAGCWATSEMIYNLRYRHDALGSLQVFWKYYDPLSVLPRELAWKVEAVLQKRDVEISCGDSVKVKLWPMSHSTVPLLWESLLACREVLGLTFEDLYGTLLGSAQRPEGSLKSNADHVSRTLSDLRRENSKTSYTQTSSMYRSHKPPIYLPSASHFNVFIHAYVRSPRRPDSTRQKSEMVERIMGDMKRFSIRPNTSTWLMLALSYIHDRKVDELLRSTQHMRNLNVLEFGKVIGIKDVSILRQLTEFLDNGSGSIMGNRTDGKTGGDPTPIGGIGKGEKEQAAMVYSALLSALIPKEMFDEARIIANWLKEDGYVIGTVRYLDDLLKVIPPQDAPSNPIHDST